MHSLNNDVDNNVLKTFDPSCSCEAEITSMINDCPMIGFGNVPPFIYSYKNTQKLLFLAVIDRVG